jgi:hypothetical protein
MGNGEWEWNIALLSGKRRKSFSSPSSRDGNLRAENGEHSSHPSFPNLGMEN